MGLKHKARRLVRNAKKVPGITFERDPETYAILPPKKWPKLIKMSPQFIVNYLSVDDFGMKLIIEFTFGTDMQVYRLRQWDPETQSFVAELVG